MKYDDDESDDGLRHGCIILTGYSVVGGLPFIHIRAAQWPTKPKSIDYPRSTWQ